MSSLGTHIRKAFPRPSTPQLKAMVSAAFVSNLGSAFQAFAFTYLTYATTQSALATVMVGVAYSLAFGVMALPAGAVARRFSHRHVVIAVSIAKAAVYSAILALELAGSLTVTAIIMASAASGITSAVQFPCWKGLMRGYSAEGMLDETNALFFSLNAVASVAGALVGGFLLDAVGPAPLFAFNVASYVPVLIVMAMLPDPADGAARPHRESRPPRAARTAIAAMLASPAVRRAVIIVALLELLAWPLIALMPKVAAEVGPQAKIYGLLLASTYAGAALVGAMLRRMKGRRRYAVIIWFATMGCGVAIFAVGAVGIAPFGTPVTLVSVALLLCAAGFTLATAASVLNAVVQLGVPRTVEGEVLGLFAITTLITGSVGKVVQGRLADVVTVWWLPLVGGCLLVVGVGAAWWRHQFRALDAAQPDSPRAHGAVMDHAQGTVGARTQRGG